MGARFSVRWGVFRPLCPVASPCALWTALVPCGRPLCPVDGPCALWPPPPKHTLFTRHTPRKPFPHTLPPTRQYFNFSRLLDHFNFSPHFSATLATSEGFFYPWSRLPTPSLHQGATLFTYPTNTPFSGGRSHFLPLFRLYQPYQHYTQVFRGYQGGYRGVWEENPGLHGAYTEPTLRLHGGYTEATRRLYGGYTGLYGGYTGVYGGI